MPQFADVAAAPMPVFERTCCARKPLRSSRARSWRAPRTARCRRSRSPSRTAPATRTGTVPSPSGYRVSPPTPPATPPSAPPTTTGRQSRIHLHGLLLDGVYRRGAEGVPEFVEVGAPTDDELHALLQNVIVRLMKMLMHRGVLVEDMGQTYLAEPDTDGEKSRTLRPLQAAAMPCRPHRASGPVLRQARTVHWTVRVRAQPTASPLAPVLGRRC